MEIFVGLFSLRRGGQKMAADYGENGNFHPSSGIFWISGGFLTPGSDRNLSMVGAVGSMGNVAKI